MTQVIGFIVLLAGTSIYNEILKSYIPPPERRQRTELQVCSCECRTTPAHVLATSAMCGPQAAMTKNGAVLHHRNRCWVTQH